jgi:uncharacterized protein YdiU (UPF0061 family)
MLMESSFKSVANLALPAELASPREPRLLAWNAPLAAELGLEAIAGDEAGLAQLFSGASAARFEPVALAYAGHQFGHFVPQLGDGRAALIGEVTDGQGRRFDVQLKGSGATPFSRGGDGRSALGPVLREYLVSEAMHHLGVPTTRALAAVATGEPVLREDLLPGAVFTRVAASHLRVGTFQYFAARGDTETLSALVDYAIERHYPELDRPDFAYPEFLAAVARRQAGLVAAWMSVGFIHGVMNTDNTSIAGETLDYGPCAFMDEFRHDKVFSSIDRHGRYAYSNQAPIAQWNLARLAECLMLLADDRDAYEAILREFIDDYEARYLKRMRAKLGLVESRPGDAELIRDFLDRLEADEADYTLAFREQADRVDADGEARFGDVEVRWRARLAAEGRDPARVRRDMNAVNPLFIPRNHRIEQAISAAIDGNLDVFRNLGRVLERPYEDQPSMRHYAEPPAKSERVTQTFCGT